MNGLMYISQKVGKYLITKITSHILFFFLQRNYRPEISYIYKEISGQVYKEITC